MNEAEAKAWLKDNLDVSRETLLGLDAFVAFLGEENERQNLVARSSLPDIWTRHIIDSAQLLRFAPSPHVRWVDLGTGAGFPGLIVAALHEGPVTLIEERRLRVAFLKEAALRMGIAGRVEIHCSKVERFESPAFDAISARAFAPLDKLLTLSHRFSTAKTRWILPKGRNAAAELEGARSSWQGDFRLERSLTDDDAGIIVAEGVMPIRQGRGAR